MNTTEKKRLTFEVFDAFEWTLKLFNERIASHEFDNPMKKKLIDAKVAYITSVTNEYDFDLPIVFQ